MEKSGKGVQTFGSGEILENGDLSVALIGAFRPRHLGLPRLAIVPCHLRQAKVESWMFLVGGKMSKASLTPAPLGARAGVKGGA